MIFQKFIRFSAIGIFFTTIISALAGCTAKQSAGAALFFTVFVLLGGCGNLSLSIEGTGSGTVSINQDSNTKIQDCKITNGIVDDGCFFKFSRSEAPLLLTATPAAGFVFVGWSGVCASFPSASCNVSAMDDEGFFVKETLVQVLFGYTLTVDMEGGNGTVTSNIGGINCLTPNTCSAPIAAGQSVTLTASASVGSIFNSWTGPTCPVDGNINTVVSFAMNDHVTCDANFSFIP